MHRIPLIYLARRYSSLWCQAGDPQERDAFAENCHRLAELDELAAAFGYAFVPTGKNPETFGLHRTKKE